MQREVTRTTLAVLSIGGLIAASFLIIMPFLGPLVWATMIVVATWPLLLRAQRLLWGRRGLAILAMTLAILAVFVVPFWAAVATFADYSADVGTWARSMQNFKLPAPPDFVDGIPFVGARVAAGWREYADMTPAALAAQFQPYIVLALKWVAAQAGTIGMLVVQFLATLMITVVLYANGAGAANLMRGFGRRLAGERGEKVIHLAAQAVRGVALGVVVTALVQAVLGGLGLWAAGVPFAGVLTAVMLMCCIAQLGPLLILVPAVLWTWWSGEHAYAIALLVWSGFVGTLDNFLRPFLIKKGADLPLLLIFAGVIGGLLSIGLLGIFVGPVVLAVTYTLFEAWVNETPGAAATPPDVSR
jgi:predicted PurR-regulated permease PerM